VAGSTGAIRAGRAFVEIGLEDSKLYKGLNKAEQRFKSTAGNVLKVGGGLVAAGTAIIAPLTAAVFKFGDMGDQVDKMSARTGVTTDALSEMGFAAEQSGSGIETLENGFKGMDKFLLNAERGLSTAKDTMDDVGLSLSELSGLSEDQKFELIADKLSKIEDPGRRAALAMQLFGRAGQQLVPLINGGAVGIQALRQEARDLGLSIGPEQAKNAAEFTDAWNRVKRSVTGVTFAIGGALVPTLTDLSRYVVDTIKVAREWVNENASMIKIAAASGVGLIVLGGALIGVAGTLFGVALGFKLLAAGISLVAGLITFLLSPLGLALVALGAIAYYSGAGAAALDWLKEKFGELAAFATESFGLIKKALDAGEYKLAAKVLWAAVKVVWYEGLQDLSDKTASWKKTFLDIWQGTIDNASSYFIDTWATLQSAWTKITQFFGDAWDLVIGGIINAWKDAQNYIANKGLEIVGAINSDFDVEGAKESLQEAHDLEKKDRSAARNQSILDRDQKTRDELKAIEDARVGAQESNSEEANRKREAREKRLADSLEASQKKVDEARAELTTLTKEVNALPDKQESAIVNGAKDFSDFAASPDGKNALGAGKKETGINLKSEEGTNLLANLFNQGSEGELLDATKDGNDLLISVIDVLNKKLNRSVELG
tara:strand:+ start:1443 stop:3419 length:1977 start_codon:yes stop_codon:yes gene_type:complete